MRLTKKWISVLLAALLFGSGLAGLGAAAPKAEAAGRVWHVTQGGAGARDGTSWADAFATLQDALEAASAGDEIWLRKGTYYPTKDIDGNDSPADPRTRTFQLKRGVAVYGGFPATADVAEPTMADRDPDAHGVVISGDIGATGDHSDNVYHVFYHPAGTNLDGAVLDGVNVYGGNANGTGDHAHGGGFFNEGVTLTLRNVKINSNQAASDGAGMYNKGSTIYFEGGGLFSNKAAGNGGGIFIEEGSITLVDLVMMSNEGRSGGGIFADDADVTVYDTTVANSVASSQGGALFFRSMSDTNTLLLAHAQISGNTANDYGGVYSESGTAKILNTSVISNQASTYGGGVYSYHSDLTVEASFIGGNEAIYDGGGMFVRGKAVINNTVITGNKARKGGGIDLTGGSPVLTNVTIADNEATEQAGGLWASSFDTPQIRNSIIWGNSSSAAYEFNPPVFEHSLIEGAFSGPGGAWDDTLGTDGGGNFDGDPVFFWRSTNPAPKHDGNYWLWAGSAAVDKGNDAYTTGFVTDRAGNSRVTGAAVDVGAYELDGDPVDVTAVAGLSSRTVSPGTALPSVPLPAEVNVTVSGVGTVRALVAWDHGTPVYDPSVRGTYTFTGHLLLPGPIGKTHKATRTITVGERTAPPAPPPAPPPPPPTPPEPAPVAFTDTAGHWAEADIVAAAQAGLVNGYPDDTFRPDEPITRLQFTVILVRALGLTGSGATIPFADRDAIPAWAADAIARAAQHGIVRGYEDGTFRPEATITRAEVATMVAGAIGLPLTDANPPFADAAAIPEWARPYVTAVHAAGLMQGQAGNRFAPTVATTRAEAAVLLLRVWRSLGN